MLPRQPTPGRTPGGEDTAGAAHRGGVRRGRREADHHARAVEEDGDGRSGGRRREHDGRFAKAAYGATPPSIAVVGAGLAGLTCAYRLKQAGLDADVYEASSRIGGRCWSIHDFDPLVAEHGGELIDQGHTAMRQLAQELGLTLDNLLQAQPNGTEDFFWVDEGKYTYDQLLADLNGLYQKLHKDTSAASYPTLWNSYTKRGW
jgi:monoamine oxidase